MRAQYSSFFLFLLTDTVRCISKAWVCDGDRDCEDNSDEDNCDALVCKLPRHTCATNDSICLPAEKLCDGTDDCPDGSDEKLCGKMSRTKSRLTHGGRTGFKVLTPRLCFSR